MDNPRLAGLSATVVLHTREQPVSMRLLGELWSRRELLYFLAWRDVKVRYRQALLGAAWAVLQPVLNMIVFTVLFGKIANLPSNGIPYGFFCYCGLVCWTYFSSVLGTGSLSLVNNASIIEKIYFPRVLLPLSTALAGLVDFAISAVLLFGLMAYYHLAPTWALLLTPLVVIHMVILTTGITMLVAALNVRYRDIKHALPFLIQIWMYATPIVYPESVIPARFRGVLALNPCWGLVAEFRACFFPTRPVDWAVIEISLFTTAALFLLGLYYFHKAERTFADIL